MNEYVHDLKPCPICKTSSNLKFHVFKKQAFFKCDLCDTWGPTTDVSDDVDIVFASMRAWNDRGTRTKSDS